MSAARDLPALSREELLALVVELQRRITELRAGHEALRVEIDLRKRGGMRRAAPFAKGNRGAEPKPPGRKPGAGTFRYREVSPPEAITEPPVDVKSDTRRLPCVWRTSGGGASRLYVSH
jgi:hypothetical protein